MSELNIYHHELRPDEYDEFYLKYEADNVIADKDKEIDQLKKSIGRLLKARTEDVIQEVISRCLIYGEGFIPVEHGMRLVAAVRHQKYKRCLSMAKWCDEVMMSCELRGYAVHRIWANRHQWAMRWKYRWLELAEKFKDKEAK